ncbi:MAG: 16S rRNA (guanine(966)-N(2))-methyltransferase RsmD [Bacteroidia bacterium]|nr:16S rRNA (guanine(966)-N(2))-methyltransferase RsmD [Bacteroidia bacterium]
MRIIAGKHKGRVLHAPKNLPVRPTTDKAKEALFNILENQYDFSSLKILDLFSGTGNITYEFLSRGAADVTAVDINYNCCTYIKQQAEKLDFKVTVTKNEIFKFIVGCENKYDLIFADPPYDFKKINQLPEQIFQNDLLNKSGLLIIEHSNKINLDLFENFKEKRKYGQSAFSFFHA